MKAQSFCPHHTDAHHYKNSGGTSAQVETSQSDATSFASGQIPRALEVVDYMLEGLAPPDLSDPISFELLRAPVRIGSRSSAVSERQLLEYVASVPESKRGAMVRYPLTNQPFPAGRLQRADDLAKKADRLRQGAEIVWRLRNDRERAWATRWIRRHDAIQQQRLAPDLSGPSGRRMAQALLACKAIDRKFAEALVATDINAEDFMIAAAQLEAILGGSKDELSINPVQVPSSTELSLPRQLIRAGTALMAVHIAAEFSIIWVNPSAYLWGHRLLSSTYPHIIEIAIGRIMVEKNAHGPWAPIMARLFFALICYQAACELAIVTIEGVSCSGIAAAIGPLLGCAIGLSLGVFKDREQRRRQLVIREQILPLIERLSAEHAPKSQCVP